MVRQQTLDITKPVALSTVASIIRTVAYKAGIREASENYKGRYNIKIAHGFRFKQYQNQGRKTCYRFY